MSPDPTDLARLLAATAQGDRMAFRRLYEATAPKLYGVALRITRRQAEAEDVLQDTYLRIWNKAGSYDASAGSALAWMAQVARHRAIDVMRAKGPIARSANEGDADWIARVPDPVDMAGRIENGETLRHCLGRLDEQARTLIVLAYCDGYSREELAARAGRPVNTIKTWLHRGLLMLKSCLDEQS